MSFGQQLPVELQNLILASIITLTLRTWVPLAFTSRIQSNSRRPTMWSPIHNLLLADPAYRHQALTTARIVLEASYAALERLLRWRTAAERLEAVRRMVTEIELLEQLVEQMEDREHIMEFMRELRLRRLRRK